MHKWDPEVALDLIEERKFLILLACQQCHMSLLKHKKKTRDISSLRGLNGGGAARPPEQVKEMRENFRYISWNWLRSHGNERLSSE